MADAEKGRPNQKSRTRKDLLRAAARLMRDGRSPSLEDVAAEAMVSRATAYRYFSGVEARLIEEPAEKDVLLKKLIGDHEPAYAQQWRDLGEEFQLKMLNGIVGFELRVTVLQCKVKINQHRKESHAAMRAMYGAGTPDEQALAVWMDRLGMTAEAPVAEGR